MSFCYTAFYTVLYFVYFFLLSRKEVLCLLYSLLVYFIVLIVFSYLQYHFYRFYSMIKDKQSICILFLLLSVVSINCYWKCIHIIIFSLLVMCMKADIEVSDEINLLMYDYTAFKDFNLTGFQYCIFYFMFIYTL